MLAQDSAGVVYARVSQVRKHALTTRARERGLSLNATLCELLGRGLAKSAQPPLEKRIRANTWAGRPWTERDQAVSQNAGTATTGLHRLTGHVHSPLRALLRVAQSGLDRMGAGFARGYSGVEGVQGHPQYVDARHLDFRSGSTTAIGD